MTINDGGSAFPETRWDDKTRQEVQWCGMSLRDYFAAKAMQGIASTNVYSINQIVENSWALADAMIAEREKE